MRKFGTDSR